jgi:hypothetical protein
LVSKKSVICPSHGARTSVPVARIAIPSPVSFSEKTGSGTFERSTIFPENGAMMFFIGLFAVFIYAPSFGRELIKYS